VQRRDFARVAHLAVVRVRIRGTWQNGLMIDVGEGGMSCAVPVDPRVGPGEPIIVEMPVGDDQLQLGATVVRTGPLPSGETVVAVSFRNLQPRTADRIRQQVFALQAQQRVRGLA
jgi:c-di-GMP-binding flagellar brake protein YcgR